MSGATSDMPARIGKTTGKTMPRAMSAPVVAMRAAPKRKAKRGGKVMTGLINRAG